MHQLPYVDEHVTDIAADVDDVWPVLLDTLDRGFSNRGATAYARLVGCTEAVASGPRPLTEDSTIPGFRVVTAIPERELVLKGRHRFSTYALAFRLEAVGPSRSRLRAETRAVFPGLLGAAYHLVVIRTGGHRVAVQRLLSGIRRSVERHARLR